MKEVIKGIALVIGGLVIFGLLIGFPIMWLWNWLMPDLFGVPEIGFWEAWGLYMLSNVLFKSTSNTRKG